MVNSIFYNFGSSFGVLIILWGSQGKRELEHLYSKEALELEQGKIRRHLPPSYWMDACTSSSSWKKL